MKGPKGPVREDPTGTARHPDSITSLRRGCGRRSSSGVPRRNYPAACPAAPHHPDAGGPRESPRTNKEPDVIVELRIYPGGAEAQDRTGDTGIFSGILRVRRRPGEWLEDCSSDSRDVITRVSVRPCPGPSRLALLCRYCAFLVPRGGVGVSPELRARGG